MTNTFTNDNGNQGTTGFNTEQNADQGSGNENTGNELQQQIEGMQKRMTDKDSHIKTVESENQELREQMADIQTKLQAMGSVEEQLARIEAAKESNQDTALDEDKLVSKVLGTLEAKTVEEKQEANFNEVSAKLTELYGSDKVDGIVAKAAEENGLTFNDMLKLAKQSPKAVYNMVGVNTSKSVGTTNPSNNTHVGYNTDNQSKEQKLAYYSKLRRENPKEYYKPETQKAFREVCLSK